MPRFAIAPPNSLQARDSIVGGTRVMTPPPKKKMDNIGHPPYFVRQVWVCLGSGEKIFVKRIVVFFPFSFSFFPFERSCQCQKQKSEKLLSKISTAVSFSSPIIKCTPTVHKMHHVCFKLAYSVEEGKGARGGRSFWRPTLPQAIPPPRQCFQSFF